MYISKEDRECIQENMKKIEHATCILKKEFVGIDPQIDQIINLIHPFYIFPKSLKTPLVINLWGLTACGKTSLVDRLVQLLSLNGKYVKFDMGEYADNNDYKLKMDLSDKIVTREKNETSLVFVLDEFQSGRTISQKGEELNRNGLRPIWDLMDTGKILLCDRTSKRTVMNYLYAYERLYHEGIQIKNGYVYGGDRERLIKLISSQICEGDFDKRKDIQYRTNALGDREVFKQRWTSDLMTYAWPVEQVLQEDHESGIAIIPYVVMCSLLEANPDYFGFKYGDEITPYMYRMVQKEIENFNLAQLIVWMDQKFFSNTDIMQEFDYSQSLVFCIGNLDEAYAMSSSHNPDDDADLFYEHSLEITIPQIKEALSERFRAEQIGRLGNNHIIYPSLNRNSYEKIIQMHLDIRVEDYKKMFELDVVFDKTINDILYNEGVFPSQGARPVLSTFRALIDSYATRLFSDMITQFPSTTAIAWFFDRSKCVHVIKCYDNNDNEYIFEYPVKLQIDNLRDSDCSEEQAFTGMHEAGHVVVSCVEAGIVPKEARSRTASLNEGFCLIEYPEIETKDLMYKKICVFLAGLEAERLVFGDDFISTGASVDLRLATQIAVSSVKLYGMSDSLYQISDKTSVSNIFTEGQSKIAEDKAIEIIVRLQTKVQDILKKYEPFLIEIGRELSVRSKLEESELRLIAEKYCDNLKNRNEYYKFKEMITARTKEK